MVKRIIKNKKLLYGILAIFVFITVGMGFSLVNKNKSALQPQCGIENCHGLDITCGPNIPESCTFEYQIGDKCRTYVSCEVINGKCQVVKSEKFEACKSCVEKCIEEFQDDPVKAFECESICPY